MLEDRKTVLELYRLYAKDPAFMESLEKSLLQASFTTSIIYNKHLTLTSIPEQAYFYIVNGKSVLE